MNDLLKFLFYIVRRELRMAFRNGTDSWVVVMFFMIVVILFPLGVGPEPDILNKISSGVIWVAALLSAMLSMDRLFHVDYDDGSLELLVLHPQPLEFIVLAKVLAHWLTTGLPLIIISPLLAIFLNMDISSYFVLIVTLFLGTPTLSLIGSIGAALILGARRSGALLSLIILPLFIPVLIFGVSAVEASILGVSSKPQLLILGGLFLLSSALCPIASAASLRQAIE